jgi:hypothetical protein
VSQQRDEWNLGTIRCEDGSDYPWELCLAVVKELLEKESPGDRFQIPGPLESLQR